MVERMPLWARIGLSERRSYASMEAGVIGCLVLILQGEVSMSPDGLDISVMVTAYYFFSTTSTAIAEASSA